MFCTHCGAKIPDGFRFCTQCGTPVKMPAPDPQAPSAAAAKATTPAQPMETQPATTPKAEAVAPQTAAPQPAPVPQPVPAPQQQPVSAPQPMPAPSSQPAAPAPQQPQPTAFNPTPAPQPQPKPAPFPQPAPQQPQPMPAPFPQPAPMPQPQTPAAPKPRRGKGIAVAAVLIIVIAIGAIALLTFKPWTAITGAGGGTAQNTESAVQTASFGSSKDVAAAKNTRIVPSKSKNEPLKHYLARIIQANDENGKPIDIFNYPQIEVKGEDGFTLHDIDADLPKGSYQIKITDPDNPSAPSITPPIAYDPSANADTDTGSDDNGGNGTTSDSGKQDDANSGSNAGSATPPEQIIITPSNPGDGGGDNATTVTQGKYAAYLKVLKDLTTQYGEPTLISTEHEAWLAGVAHAQLKDFGDGVERLVVTIDAAADAKTSPYVPYEDGSWLVRVYTYDPATDSVGDPVEAKYSWTNGGYIYTTYGTSADGSKSYLISESDAGATVWGVKDDGTFGQVFSYSVDYTGDSLTPTISVNGQASDADAAQSQLSQYTSGEELWWVSGNDAKTGDAANFVESFNGEKAHSPNESGQGVLDLIAKLEGLEGTGPSNGSGASDDSGASSK